jgi:hypothetical protein
VKAKIPKKMTNQFNKIDTSLNDISLLLDQDGRFVGQGVMRVILDGRVTKVKVFASAVMK